MMSAKASDLIRGKAAPEPLVAGTIAG